MTHDKTSSTVIMAGLPETGKSTYLGALYHVLESGTGQPISLDALPYTRQHLEGVRERWLKVESENRTSSVSPIENELKLRFNDGSDDLKIRWPDLSGEYFDEMVRKRTVKSDVAAILDSASSIMLFIHPDSITQQPRIYEINQAMEGITNGNQIQDSEEDEIDSEANQIQDWDSMMMPGEVLIVELLQLLLAYSFDKPIHKISIIISAWDSVSSGHKSPTLFMTKKLPFLEQYIQSNSDSYQFKLFGVSALGGDPEQDKVELQSTVEPIQRIIVVDDDGNTPDNGILAPLLWLLE